MTLTEKLARLRAQLENGRGHGSPNCSTDEVLALVDAVEAAGKMYPHARSTALNDALSALEKALGDE